MDYKQSRAFEIVSNYLEAHNASQDSFSLENRIIHWDSQFPNLSVLQLASLTIANLPNFIYISDSDIREITQRLFHSLN